MQKLIELNLIKPSGRMVGKTKQIPVFILNLKEAQKRDAYKTNDPKNGIGKHPKNGTLKRSQKRDAYKTNDPKNGIGKHPKNGTLKRSQKRDTEPSVSFNHQLEPSIKDIKKNIKKKTPSASDKSGKAKNKRFAKPSVQEIKKYCDERNNSVDPQAFVDYYESNGWKVGRNSMKDWKAAIRTWERNRFNSNPSPQIDDYDNREPTKGGRFEL